MPLITGSTMLIILLRSPSVIVAVCMYVTFGLSAEQIMESPVQ